MQIKTTRSYYFTPGRMAIITMTITGVGKDVEEWEPLRCWRGYKMVWLLWKIIWQHFTKFNRRYGMTEQFHSWVYT